MDSEAVFSRILRNIIPIHIDSNRILKSRIFLKNDAPYVREDYKNRIGRTTLAEESGVAITFITQNDFQRFHRIEKLIGKTLTPLFLPEHIGVSLEFNSITRSKRPQRNSASKGNNSSSNNRKQNG